MKMLLDSDADPKTMLAVLQTYESVMGTGTAADLMASVAPSRSKIIPSMSSVFSTGLWFGSENALQEKMMKFLISEGDEQVQRDVLGLFAQGGFGPKTQLLVEQMDLDDDDGNQKLSLMVKMVAMTLDESIEAKKMDRVYFNPEDQRLQLRHQSFDDTQAAIRDKFKGLDDEKKRQVNDEISKELRNTPAGDSEKRNRLEELGKVTGFKDDEQLQQRTTESNIKQSQTLEQLKEASENEAQKERVDSLIQASAELKTAITENQSDEDIEKKRLLKIRPYCVQLAGD